MVDHLVGEAELRDDGVGVEISREHVSSLSNLADDPGRRTGPAEYDPLPVVVDGIRNADPAEVEALTELQRRASMVWEEYRADLLAHPDAIEIPIEAMGHQSVRVAVGDGQVLGFSVVLPGGDGRWELDGLFVEPEHMGRGVGRLLVAGLAAMAMEAGVTRVDVTANPRAVGFYQRIGFVTDGTIDTQFGPALRMHLEP